MGRQMGASKDLHGPQGSAEPKQEALSFSVIISAVWIQTIADMGSNCGVIWGFRPRIQDCIQNSNGRNLGKGLLRV